jgi:membrane-associated protease RseP (regulator of RpoE activity)
MASKWSSSSQKSAIPAVVMEKPRRDVLPGVPELGIDLEPLAAARLILKIEDDSDGSPVPRVPAVAPYAVSAAVHVRAVLLPESDAVPRVLGRLVEIPGRVTAVVAQAEAGMSANDRLVDLDGEPVRSPEVPGRCP